MVCPYKTNGWCENSHPKQAGAAANNQCAVNNHYYSYCINCIKTQGAQYHQLN